MLIRYASFSVAGPVREHNEDFTSFFQPPDNAGRREHGAVMALADGVGGEQGGEVASRLACETAVQIFRDAPADISPQALLSKMFDAANQAVFEQRERDDNRMATTLSISLLRNGELHIGHVGDCRVYLIHNGQIACLTTDHSYAGVQVKLGLMTAEEARYSDLRSVLTRAVGSNPTVEPDFYTASIEAGDFVVHCCDGLYCYLTEREILDAITQNLADLAARWLVDQAIVRTSNDNLSIQIAQVDEGE